MGFDLVIFDTAPTGHTLKLLNFPTTMEAALTKLLGMRDKMKGMMSMFGGQADFEGMFNKAFTKMEEVKKQSEKFKAILTNPVVLNHHRTNASSSQCVFRSTCRYMKPKDFVRNLPRLIST